MRLAIIIQRAFGFSSSLSWSWSSSFFRCRINLSDDDYDNRSAVASLTTTTMAGPIRNGTRPCRTRAHHGKAVPLKKRSMVVQAKAAAFSQTAGVAALRRGLRKGENAGLGARCRL
jgi:hypothetical protein